MDLEDIILSEVSQTKTNAVCYHVYIGSKNEMNDHNKTETDSQMQRTNQQLPIGREGSLWQRIKR